MLEMFQKKYLQELLKQLEKKILHQILNGAI